MKSAPLRMNWITQILGYFLVVYSARWNANTFVSYFVVHFLCCRFFFFPQLFVVGCCQCDYECDADFGRKKTFFLRISSFRCEFFLRAQRCNKHSNRTLKMIIVQFWTFFWYRDTATMLRIGAVWITLILLSWRIFVSWKVQIT